MARARRPRFGLVFLGFGLVIIAAITASMLYRDPNPAPTAPGVCWRMTFENDRTNFHPLLRDIPNLETCAAALERMHLREHADAYGAYQGRYIFATAAQITAAPTLTSVRWPVFYAPQRKVLDQKLLDQRTVPTVTTVPDR